MTKWIVSMILLLGFYACSNPTATKINKDIKEQALENGKLANEGFRRSMDYTKAWLNYADSVSGLIPQNVNNDKNNVWDPHNAAADNYPFMVLSGYILDKELYQSKLLKMLHTEKKLTSRLGNLSAVYALSNQQFVRNKADTQKIIFQNSEYMKDGLLPIIEYIGSSPFSERLLGMLEDLQQHVTIASVEDKDYYGHKETEINGELMQILSRVYWMTGNQKWLDWATQIGDHYLLNDTFSLRKAKRLRLRDHGCEIVGGLSELYVTLHVANREKKKAYKAEINKLFDRILQVGRNEDGLFYNEVNMLDGEVIDSAIADTWGYLFDAYYTVYLVDSTTRYLQAVKKPLNILNQKYRHYNWEKHNADGYADAIESGLYIYNREHNDALAKWMDNEIQLMWSLQDSNRKGNMEKWKNSGVIEGWHGDGNFARTSLMYSLWKTKGVTIEPWTKDVVFGSVIKDSTLYVVLKAEKNWEGTVTFDDKRYKNHFRLPIDYPRLNSFPEWYAVQADKDYSVIDHQAGTQKKYKGKQLIKGISLQLTKNEPHVIQAKPVR